MKKLLSFLLVFVMIFSVTSCGFGFLSGLTHGGFHLYNDFTSSEKAIFNRYIGEVIPFVPNNNYSVDGYYDVDDYENGINFYTVGNTEAEFLAYLELFSEYTLDEIYEDDAGDTWYCYIKDDVVVDLAYYCYDGVYWIDVYVYSSLSEGGDNEIITNKDKGLPTAEDGVHEIDFTKATKVKDVTDQGYYLDGCPTTGSPAVLVIPVDFKDATAADKGYTTEKIAKIFSGKSDEVDYYSVHDYYYISSFGALDLDITVLDYWFRPEHKSSYYASITEEIDGVTEVIGDQLVINEALEYLEDKMDLSRFDSDGNGTIDSIVIIETLDVDPDDLFYWAYRYWSSYTDGDGEYYEYDGVRANDYLWASYQFIYEGVNRYGETTYDNTSNMSSYTYIHEFGHVLGADDYYDTAYIQEPMGGYDIMDGMLGDHNAFTKFNYGWLTASRLVVAEESITLTLEDFSKHGDSIIIGNNWDDSLGAYQEYYLITYYTNNSLNAGEYGYFNENGILVYHVNASLFKSTYGGNTYYDVYNNNTHPSDEYGTENNLIELVERGKNKYIFRTGDSLGVLTDDNGERLIYTFTVDLLTEDTATITFSRR